MQKNRRVWCPNTILNKTLHFYIDTRIWDITLFDKIRSTWTTLLAPSQSGKTNRAVKTLKPISEENGYFFL